MEEVGKMIGRGFIFVKRIIFFFEVKGKELKKSDSKNVVRIFKVKGKGLNFKGKFGLIKSIGRRCYLER